MSAGPVSFGFLRPEEGRVIAADPVVTYGEERVVVDGRAADWDYNTPVKVEWPLVVDTAAIRADCGLGPGAVLNALITWHSSWTNLRGAGPGTALLDGANALSLDIPGGLIGGTLNLVLTVTLSNPGIQPEPFAPHRPGSPLWSSRTAVTLEGGGARLPVMAVDFATTGRGRDHGLWLLECEQDLTASAAGGLLLYLNTGNQEIKMVLDQPNDPSAELYMRFISYDVTRQLILRALQHEELDDRMNYERGTIGELFINLLQTQLPGRNLQQARREFEDDPGEIEAELLARTWVVG